MVVTIRTGLSTAPPSLLALCFPLFDSPSPSPCFARAPRPLCTVGWEGGAGHPSDVPFLALNSYLSLMLFCKATINLNSICFAKANLMGTFAEEAFACNCGPATFPLRCPGRWPPQPPRVQIPSRRQSPSEVTSPYCSACLQTAGGISSKQHDCQRLGAHLRTERALQPHF